MNQLTATTDERWCDLVDLDSLTEWMDGQSLERGPLTELSLLSGGTQNVLLHFRRGTRNFVLRRPPRFSLADGNATMRREAVVLKALAGTDVPHARLIAACDNIRILGSEFYLMEPVDGFNATSGLADLHLRDVSVRRRMGFSMVDAIVKLGAVKYKEIGLDQLGRPDGFLERQVPKWRKQLNSYSNCDGWPGQKQIPGVNEIGRWLDEYRPAQFTPGIMHGDYHLANVMFANQSPEVAAIVDWELTTIGDPLLDLGWLIATWPDELGHGLKNFSVHPWGGFPSAEELIARYEQESGRDLSQINWYVVLACYKLGIILEGTFARACAGQASIQVGEQLHESALWLFEKALNHIGCSP